MINKPDKNKLRKKRHLRIRKNIKGTGAIPRLNVYRSLNNIYAQIIDDVIGNTLVSASTLEKTETTKEKTTKVDDAKFVGEMIAKRAIEKGINKVVFDRSGYLYTGRVQAVADGARNGGLEF
ncbi:MAG: 50S ribosomal protein L18 [Christensenellaceae bacterium]|jgi:large subunit ribosomal protein L18|nr:50S ribosomal protein L18 [Christensenellaceae bacterium]